MFVPKVMPKPEPEVVAPAPQAFTAPAPQHLVVTPAEQADPTMSEMEVLAAQFEAKFGFPPHHRMKLETIKARLEE